MAKNALIKVTFYSADNRDLGEKDLEINDLKPKCSEYKIPKSAKKMVVCFTRANKSCEYCCVGF